MSPPMPPESSARVAEADTAAAIVWEWDRWCEAQPHDTGEALAAETNELVRLISMALSAARESALREALAVVEKTASGMDKTPAIDKRLAAGKAAALATAKMLAEDIRLLLPAPPKGADP